MFQCLSGNACVDVMDAAVIQLPFKHHHMRDEGLVFDLIAGNAG